MTAKRITGLGLVALSVLAGVFLAVSYRGKSSAIPEHAAVDGASGKDVHSAESAVSVSPISVSSETEHAGVPQATGRSEAVAVRNVSAEDIARLERIQAGVEVSEIEDALEFLRSQGDTERESALAGNLVRQWAESDIEQAARWVENMPAGEVRQQAVKDVAIMLANKDAAGGISWARKLPEGEERDSALISVAYEIVRTAPLLAMEIAVELPVAKNSDELIQHAALQWAGSDPEGAARWAASAIPDSALKERVQANIATAWGVNDPVRSAQYAVLSMVPGRAQDDAVIGIVQRWVQIDPVAAANWVSLFPDGVLSETAAENVVRLWPGGMP